MSPIISDFLAGQPTFPLYQILELLAFNEMHEYVYATASKSSEAEVRCSALTDMATIRPLAVAARYLGNCPRYGLKLPVLLVCALLLAVGSVAVASALEVGLAREDIPGFPALNFVNFSECTLAEVLENQVLSVE